MTPEVRAALLSIQQRVVEHYKRVLRQSMSDQERKAIEEKLAREESVLSEIFIDRRAA
jgi:hypothetical protein